MVLYGIDTVMLDIDAEMFYLAVSGVTISIPSINCRDIREEIDCIANRKGISVKEAVHEFLHEADLDGVGKAQIFAYVINARRKDEVYLSADNNALGIRMDNPWNLCRVNSELDKERFRGILSDEIRLMTGSTIENLAFIFCD